MGNVTENRRTALLAERSAAQAHRAAAASQHAAQQAPQSTVGKAISAANTALKVYGDVMGAYGKVMGFTGDLAEKAVVAVFSKLSFMQGLACLPASSQLDPVIGIDVHLVMIPPSPSPIPMPHPYIATVFNPKDFIACAVNTVTAAIPPPPPDSAGLQLASTVGNMAKGMIMGKLGLSATVKLGAATPRTHSGTKNKCIPHFPMGASFAPTPILKDSGEAFFGALLLLADGEPFTGMMHLNYNCWDIGIKALARAGGDPDAQHLYMPTGFVMAIPSHNVIISPIPTPINPIKALTKILNFGLAKLLQGIVGKLPLGRLGDALSKAICHVTGHPVDIASGMLFTDEEDFSLPGVIPFSWERTWYSDSNYDGPLGHGWYHNYDMGFAIDEYNRGIFRMNDGRYLAFELPPPGKFSFDRGEKFFLHCHREERFYYVTDRDGLIYQFTDKLYKNRRGKTEDHLLKSISNASGYAISFRYNDSGELIKIIDSAGRLLVVLSDEKKRIESILAPHPYEAEKTFTIARYEYDAAGNMTCHTDAIDHGMRYEYRNNLLVKETWRNGHQWYFEYDGQYLGAKCIHTWGDGDIYNHKLTYKSGITVVENSLGHTTTFYIKDGLISGKIDGNGALWEYRYNKYHELEWETDPLGNQQSYAHDAWGNIVTGTDPSGGFYSNEYYNPNFPLLPMETLDAGGGKWKWEYDEQGCLTERTNSLGAKTKYVYDDGLVTKVVNPSGAITKLRYDKTNNLIAIQTDTNAIIEYKYDFLGNCVEIINPNVAKQKRIYDLRGRIKEVVDFDGNIIRLKYDGIDNLIEYRDDQKNVKYTYRGLWKMTSRSESGASIIFNYDTEERLHKVINEHGQNYRFERDAAGKIIGEIGFDDISYSYERNAAGWLTQVLRPAGKSTKYQYDPSGRITEVLYSDGEKQTYKYRADGEVIRTSNESATILFKRDVAGNILEEVITDEWVRSEYDIYGNRTRITSSGEVEISHSYNKMGDALETDANGWLVKYDHDKLGFETKRLLPGGISNEWQRDKIGRPVVQTIGHTSGNSFITRKRKQYQWDINDRLKQIKDENGITRFERDQWGNLSKTIFPNGEEQLHNPDVAGNIFRTSDRTDRLYGKGGQLKKADGWKYNYDAEGNLIEKKHVKGNTWLYEWNDAGMLTKVIRPDQNEVIFTYDPLGRRISKQFKNTITKFLWDGNVLLHEWKEHALTGEKLSNIKAGDNDITTWLFDAGNYTLAGKIKGNRQYSIITDHLGTPSQMYKEDGALFWECDLDSYGKIRMEKGEVGSCPFRYQGQYEDAETGLYYNRFRYYSTEEGMYLSQDPTKLFGGLKFYGYVIDTSNWIDIFGLAGDPVVTATFETGGDSFQGTNPTARETRETGPMPGLAGPNSDKNTMHAEIEAMNKADVAGKSGGEGTLTVTGKIMCAYCKGAVKTMAKKLGLSKLTVHDADGRTHTFEGKELEPTKKGGKGYKFKSKG